MVHSVDPQAGVKQAAVGGAVGADQPLSCLLHSPAGLTVYRQTVLKVRGNANQTRSQAAVCKQVQAEHQTCE